MLNGLKMPLLDYEQWKRNNGTPDALFKHQKEYKEKNILQRND